MYGNNERLWLNTSSRAREEKYACSAAGPVKDELFAKLDRGAVDVDSEFIGVLVLRELVDGIYEMAAGGAEELSADV